MEEHVKTIMTKIDWAIVVAYCLGMLGLGLYFARRASKSVDNYFVAGRTLPWWVIGFSTVANYSCAGAAPAFTMLVFLGGMLGSRVWLGNVDWWIPYAIWMPLVAVIWSKLWRRLRVITTAEFIEQRYGGKPAGVVRGIYALVMSLGWAVVLNGWVIGWLPQALCPILGWSKDMVILSALGIVLIYCTLSGLFGAAYGDVYQFLVFMIGNIILIPVILSKMGGLSTVYQQVEQTRGIEFFNMLPPEGIGLTLFALVIQGMFFAAAPSGGEGYTAQLFMSAKNEYHAQVGQLFASVMSLVVRVIPFMFLGIIAAALYKLPSDTHTAETVLGPTLWGNLVARFSVPGLTGIIVAAELAAFLSTIDTQMNWGGSYLVNDVYKRFIKREATPKHYVWMSRLASIIVLVLGVLVAYFLVTAMNTWFMFINNIIIAFILPLSWLRFFWWRLNVYGEGAAIVLGIPLGTLIWFPLGGYGLNFAAKPFWQGFLMLFVAGWVTILLVTLLTRPENIEVLKRFYQKCRPPGFWGPITRDLTNEERNSLRQENRRDIFDAILGVIFCLSTIWTMTSLFGRHWNQALGLIVVILLSGGLFAYRWSKRGIFKGLKESPDIN
jgi:Na+/proline symporter